MAIRVIVTGGTFDKAYDAINGHLYFKSTHLKEMFETGRCTVPLEIEKLMLIDSLEMTEMERELIAEKVASCAEEQILITHGTDTMVETAAHLAQKNLVRTIVLTGAMIPYEFGSSDGFFNLGNALGFVQCLPHGVYVVMNGRALPWDKVRKNKATGFFNQIHVEG